MVDTPRLVCAGILKQSKIGLLKVLSMHLYTLSSADKNRIPCAYF